MSNPLTNALKTVTDAVSGNQPANENTPQDTAMPENVVSGPGFLSTQGQRVDDRTMQVIRNRFLRNFDRVEVCDAINTDISGDGKLPTGHLHIRFWMPDDVAEKLNTYQKMAYLNQEADRGKFLLSQYGITAHDEVVVEKVHRDPKTGKVSNGWVQYDVDFAPEITNHPEFKRGDIMRKIEADLNQGIEQAKAARGMPMSMA